MAIFTFRNVRYNSDILEKVCNEGHLIAVDKDLIVQENAGGKDKQVVAFKVDNKYHLLQGTLDTKHNKPTILCITKFTLKKCKVETVQPVAANQSFQSKWNDDYNRNQRSY